MQRSEYIEELEAIRARLLVLGADFAALQLTDENDNEKSRRKCAGKLFEKLNAQLYDNGAVSLRIMQDNANAGIGEQGDLFDEARVESATNEDDGDEGQGEEDHGDDLPPADGVEFPPKPMEVCRFVADAAEGGSICTLDANYGNPCDGLSADCAHHEPEKKTRRGKKGAK